jgi:hypothetical protein
MIFLSWLVEHDAILRITSSCFLYVSRSGSKELFTLIGAIQ